MPTYLTALLMKVVRRILTVDEVILQMEVFQQKSPGRRCSNHERMEYDLHNGPCNKSSGFTQERTGASYHGQDLHMSYPPETDNSHMSRLNYSICHQLSIYC